ncbi:MAG: hypothetical protein ABJH45_12135 [Paracoccaceae bacterium]|uniref:hypothetical protein n=2 Tax=Sedimentitalea sp. TaxID=2048915 RepID=UPI0032679446
MTLSLLNYLASAKTTPTHYYNKVMQYQLERIGDAMGAFQIPAKQTRIQLEAREQQYSSLLSFIEKIQNNPLDSRATSIRNIDRFSISSVNKKDSLLMALSDIGANAIFSSVRRDTRQFGFSEVRYLRELAPIFVTGKTGRIVPKGLKPIHSIEDLGLPSETIAELYSLTNSKKDYRRFA